MSTPKDQSTLASTTSGAPQHDTFEPPGQRFELGDELGRGGMGRVIAAKDLSLGREVAIKHVLSSHPEDIARFEREVRITALLEHPAIVPIHETGQDDRGTPYYVMRRIEGEPLHERIGRAPDVKARLALIPSLLAAVDAAAFAHARGVIHRDIKPANILLGAYGETLLIDWGLSRLVTESDIDRPGGVAPGDQLTLVGAVVGTPGYMSPEQARGEPVDARTDVFALGATLYHVLAGKPPFADKSAEERIAAAVLGERPSIQALDPGIPPELVAIIDKALASKLDERYRDAGELARDLHAFLDGKLVAAHHYTARERFGRFVRRNRVSVAVAVVASLALIAGGVIAVVNIVRQRDVARAAQLDAERAGEEAVRNGAELADRADAMLLDKATTLAALQPTRTIISLRQLRPDSKYTRRARDIAEAAAASGIARGSSLHDRPVRMLELSPDSRWLLSGGDDGRLAIHDIARGGGRVVTQFPERIDHAVWTEQGTSVVVATHDDALVVLDPVTAVRRRILDPAVKVGQLWAIDEGRRVRYVDRRTRELREVGVAEGAPIVVLAGAVFAIDDGSSLVAATTKGIVLITAGTRRTFPIKLDPDWVRLVLSESSQRFAVIGAREVTEWSFEGKPLGAWPLRTPFAGRYHRDRLLVTTAEGVIHELRAQSSGEVARAESGPSWVGPTRSGVAFGFIGGSVILIDDAGPHHVSMEQHGRMLATSRQSLVVAVGSSTGDVTWKDLATVHPPPMPLWGSVPCALAPDRAYLLQAGRIVEVDRRTEQPRDVHTTPLPVSRCLGLAGNTIVVSGSTYSALVDVVSGDVTRLETSMIALTRRDRVVFARDRDIVEIDPRTRVETVLWHAPSPISVFAATADGALAAFDGTKLAVVRDGTITQLTTSLPVDALGITARGDIWFVSGHHLRWHIDGVERHGYTFPRPLVFWYAEDEDISLVLDDRSVWFARRDGVDIRVRGSAATQISFGPGFATTRESPTVMQVVRMATGERYRRTLPHGLAASNALRTGEIVVTTTHHLGIVYETVVPLELDAYRRWLETATNGRLEAGEVSWR